MQLSPIYKVCPMPVYFQLLPHYCSYDIVSFVFLTEAYICHTTLFCGITAQRNSLVSLKYNLPHQKVNVFMKETTFGLNSKNNVTK